MMIDHFKNVKSHEFKKGFFNSSYPYKVWDMYTVLELMWFDVTGTQKWIVMNNPLLCSFDLYQSNGCQGYSVYANGYMEQRGWGRTTNETDLIVEYPIVHKTINQYIGLTLHAKQKFAKSIQVVGNSMTESQFSVSSAYNSTYSSEYFMWESHGY
jgi:hypothetical protein